MGQLEVRFRIRLLMSHDRFQARQPLFQIASLFGFKQNSSEVTYSVGDAGIDFAAPYLVDRFREKSGYICRTGQRSVSSASGQDSGSPATLDAAVSSSSVPFPSFAGIVKEAIT
jgi:hypothetical protein